MIDASPERYRLTFLRDFQLLKDTKIKRVYALVRAEPGKEQERLEKCWATYAPLSAGSMKLDKRIVAVRGDITAGPLLGMEPEVVETLRQEVRLASRMHLHRELMRCAGRSQSLSISRQTSI